MTDENEQRPAGPPFAGDEVATLLGSLERVRSFIGWKCGGLDDAGIRTTAAASTITLGGLLKHLAFVEEDYFTWRFLGRRPRPPWGEVDWEADPDWDWRVNDDDTPETIMALWRESVARSRAIVAEALPNGGLDQLGRFTTDQGESPNLRHLFIDLIEEYARHAGHADIIRESIDGVVGEDPPGPIPV
jgi:uncharacterized protein DUF664